jgi:lysozyme
MKSFLQHLKEQSMFAPMMLSAALGAGTPQPQTKPEQTQTQQTQKAPKPAWYDLVSKSEGIRTKAYWDPTGKVWTIGKGSTTHPDGRPVKQGDVITSEQADEYMQDYVNKNLVPKLQKRIPTWDKLNTNQQGALISFGYNVGPNFYGSKGFESITKCLNCEQNLSGVPQALKKYNKSGGKSLPGLITRREAEGTLWNTPVQ